MSDPINRSRQRQRDLERAQFNASMKPEQARELHESVDREARDLLNALLDAMAIAQSDTNAVATPVANALCSLDVAARTAGFFDAAQLIIVMQAEVESALVQFRNELIDALDGQVTAKGRDAVVEVQGQFARNVLDSFSRIRREFQKRLR